MVPDFVLLYAVVIVLLPLVYFAFASLPFLLVRLDVPEVAQLFRGLFNSYFWMVAVCGIVGSVAFAAGGRIAFMGGLLLLAIAAVTLRRRTLQQIDAQQAALRGGDAAAMRRLRTVHWGTMAANMLVVAFVASSVRFVL